MSLKPLRWAVSVGRVSTELGKKCFFAQLDRPTTNQSNVVCCLLKTNSAQALCGDVVDYVTVDHLSIIVYSRLDSLIGTNSSCSGIVFPQPGDPRPNFPTIFFCGRG